jgi:hypothetical protein
LFPGFSTASSISQSKLLKTLDDRDAELATVELIRLDAQPECSLRHDALEFRVLFLEAFECIDFLLKDRELPVPILVVAEPPRLENDSRFKWRMFSIETLPLPPEESSGASSNAPASISQSLTEHSCEGWGCDVASKCGVAAKPAARLAP